MTLPFTRESPQTGARSFVVLFVLLVACSGAQATVPTDDRDVASSPCDPNECEAGYECIDNGVGTPAYCRKPCTDRSTCGSNEICYVPTDPDLRAYCAFSSTRDGDAAVADASPVPNGASKPNDAAVDSGKSDAMATPPARNGLGLCRNPSCSPEAEDAVVACAKTTCDAQLQTALGPSYKQGVYAGACGAYAKCYAGCSCSDSSCLSACQQAIAKECLSAVLGVASCMKGCNSGSCGLKF